MLLIGSTLFDNIFINIITMNIANAQLVSETNYWQLINEIGSCNDKWQESLITKADIIDKLIQNLNFKSATVLFAGFNPIAIYLAKKYQISIICNYNLNDIFDFSNITVYPTIESVNQKFDIVLCLDEYFTYASSEEVQRQQLEQISKVTDGWVITTLQDYKNLAPHKKNQIDSSVINGGNNYIVIDHSVSDRLDKQLFNNYWLCIKDHNELFLKGPSIRRTMYFKQLAKYSSDIGSKQYVIQKNLLYKGFFSKNFEHIITINF